MENTKLYHISGWEELFQLQIGDSFTLRPGTQCAEGKGVYFSENQPRPSAAEGSFQRTAITIEIVISSSKGWWKTKNSICHKFGRPRTYHSCGKNIKCHILDKQGWNKLTCSWEWA